MSKSAARGTPPTLVDPVAPAEQLTEDVAGGVEQDARADAAGASAQPPEEERREKDGEPRRLTNGREVTEREDHAGDDESRAHARAEDSNALRQRVVEARLQVAPVKRLLG